MPRPAIKPGRPKNQGGWSRDQHDVERTDHGGRTDMMVEVRQLAELRENRSNAGPAWDIPLRQETDRTLACEPKGYFKLSPAYPSTQGTAAGPEGSIMKLGRPT